MDKLITSDPESWLIAGLTVFLFSFSLLYFLEPMSAFVYHTQPSALGKLAYSAVHVFWMLLFGGSSLTSLSAIGNIIQARIQK